MKTAQEMYQYCLDNKTGYGFNQKWGLKHFSIIEDLLQPDEEVIVTFIGLHNYISMTNHENNYAYALTNRRLITAQSKLIGHNVKVIYLDNLNDITMSTSLKNAIITFDTLKEKINVNLSSSELMQNIYNLIINHINLIKNSNQTIQPVNNSNADELAKYHSLMQQDIITPDEFEIKKKQLLSK